MANIVGTAGDDVLDGTLNNDVIDGGRGNDRLSGGGGSDRIAGGAGADVIDGGEGGDLLYSAYGLFQTVLSYSSDPGGPYPNYIVRASLTPPFDTGTEHDVLIGGAGSDTLSIGYGDDADAGDGGYQDPVGPYYPDFDSLIISFMGASSGMTIDFTTINQTIAGGVISGIENVAAIQGTAFDDTIIAGATGGAIFGMGGDDRLTIGGSTQYMDGGDGSDVLDARNAVTTPNHTLPTLAGGAGDDTILGAPKATFNIFGGEGDDHVIASGYIHGEDGNDHIEVFSGVAFGDAGDDTIAHVIDPTLGDYGAIRAAGGAGADTIIGSESADTLATADAVLENGPMRAIDDVGLEHDLIRAGGGNDIVSGGSGDDLDGGAGTDELRLSLAASSSGITFDANAIADGKTVVVAGGTIQGFEELTYLRTTDFDDVITLRSQTRYDIYQSQTRDLMVEVHAGAGNDVITAGDTVATVYGDAGNDRFVSGKAADYFNGGSDSDTVDYSAYALDVTVLLAAGSGADGDVLVSVENAIGSAYADTMVGSAEANSLSGGGGRDVLTGGLGADRLTGGAGNDVFRDTIAGHAGDTIVDFEAGDAIVFTDASLGSFTFSLSGSTLTFSGGSLTFGSTPPTGFVATAVAGGGVRLTLAAPNQPTQFFEAAGAPLIVNFNSANGWTSQTDFPRHAVDVNGDGRADVVGFGYAGLYVASAGAGGSFGPPTLALRDFGQDAGWADDNGFHRFLADLNGDGRADVVGFGYAGTLVSLSLPDGSFGAVTTGLADFGHDQGWESQDGFARLTGDVNGDGKADIVGFGYAGALVALGHGDGSFAPVETGIANFGVDQGWTSDDRYHRELADVNGDGKADLIGFGMAGTYVALSNGDGSFADARLVLNVFGTSQGWTSNDGYRRIVADVNGDHIADIVGYGASGVVVALGNGDGTFAATRTDVADFGRAQGYVSDDLQHRELADINGDGFLDIVGFGNSGVVSGLNNLGYAA